MERLEQSSKNKQISVIIPTLNEERSLPDLLAQINKSGLRDYEIIVADANSIDQTALIARNSGAKVVQGGNISFGRNAGAFYSKGKILVFMDADINFDYDFLQESLVQFQNHNLDVAITLFDSTKQKITSRILYALSDFAKKLTEKKYVKFGTCQCIFITREAFNLIGGFDSEISIGEDIDFMKKISKFNLKYQVLDTRIKASDRRFSRIGIMRVLLGSMLIAIFIGFNIIKYKSIQKFIEKIYGGWGKN
jgi:glycosyltransferase involved in cell wall biosynthesis